DEKGTWSQGPRDSGTGGRHDAPSTAPSVGEARSHEEGHGCGLVLFASILLLVVGCSNLIQGIAAIANSHVFVANAHYVWWWRRRRRWRSPSWWCSPSFPRSRRPCPRPADGQPCAESSLLAGPL